MILTSVVARLRDVASRVENADVGTPDQARALLTDVLGELMDIGLDLQAAVTDHFQPSERA